LLVPAVMDIRWQELPVEYLGWLGVMAFVFRLAVDQRPGDVVVSTLLALAGILVFFGSQIIVSRGKWLGVGDMWFGGFMAGVLGWPGIGIAVYVAYLLGGTLAVMGLLTRAVKRTTRIAFGPMLAVGVLIAVWYGNAIVDWLARIYA
jgi:prepilin signal peptidase PulO-like enzyme (type II secretory pathway)